jgi:hypothetical protein
MTIANKCYCLGFNIEQGIGFSEFTTNWPLPILQTNILTIKDSNSIDHTLVFDSVDQTFYEIGLREKVVLVDSNELFKDKLTVSGTSGNNIPTEVDFKSDIGESEKFILEHYTSRFYFNPINIDNINNTNEGFDSLGLLSGLSVTSDIYSNDSLVATSTNIPKNNDSVYHTKVEGNRLQTVLKTNVSNFRLVGRQQDYIVKDIQYDIEDRNDEEYNFQSIIAEPVQWFTRGEDPSKDRISGNEISGTFSLTSGLDGIFNSSISTSSTVTFPFINISSIQSVFISMWVSGSPRFIFGKYDSWYDTNFNNYGSQDGWSLRYKNLNPSDYLISGETPSTKQLSVLPFMDSIELYDIRIYTQDLTSNLGTYFTDILIDNGNNILPII